MAKFKFDDVSLLITVYNRSSSLELLLQGFRNLDVSFGEVIVSDDGSQPEHLAALEKLAGLYNFKLIKAPVNSGLGNNINKGQQAVTLPYTVYIQEDFIPSSQFGDTFSDALKIMQADQGLDLIRFYGYFKYPYLKPYNKVFSEIEYKPDLWHSNHLKFYAYSDHPHLRRSNFLNKFGKYPEGLIGDLTELYMSFSFIKNKGRALVLNDLTLMLDQYNSQEEPTTMDYRSDWKTNRGLGTRLLRQVYLKYRLLKNTVQLAMVKPREKN